MAAGLAVHVFADFSWALLFFGVLAPWTRRLGPPGLLVVALPWALATAAVEYYAVLPWLQPRPAMHTRCLRSWATQVGGIQPADRAWDHAWTSG